MEKVTKERKTRVSKKTMPEKKQPKGKTIVMKDIPPPEIKPKKIKPSRDNSEKEKLLTTSTPIKTNFESLLQDISQRVPPNFKQYLPTELELTSDHIPYKFTLDKVSQTDRVYSLEVLYVEIYWNKTPSGGVHKDKSLKVYIY